jgi:hypothetical protein
MMSKVLKLFLILLAFSFSMEATPVSYVLHGFHGYWMSTAEAIIGRPATPVSVAGVARRTVRRY